MPTSEIEIEFSDLLARHHSIISSICQRCCKGDSFYYDELHQECILEMWLEYSRYKLTRFQGNSTEATWIFSICHHAIAHYYRNPKNAEFQLLCDEHDFDCLFTTETSDGRHLIEELSQQLTPNERSILTHYLNDESYTAISRIENISNDSARQRMSRLIKKLKMLVRK